MELCPANSPGSVSSSKSTFRGLIPAQHKQRAFLQVQNWPGASYFRSFESKIGEFIDGQDAQVGQSKLCATFPARAKAIVRFDLLIEPSWFPILCSCCGNFDCSLNDDDNAVGNCGRFLREKGWSEI